MSSDVEWRWADPNGQQRLVREDELRAALASGLVPPNAPVWKNGWHDWKPAYDVPELTTSALSAVNGVVPNIPPPGGGALGAQKDLEKEAPGTTRASNHAEPPPPPRYVAAATRVSQVPPAPASNASPVGKQIPAPSPSSTLVEVPSEKVRAVALADESNTGVKLGALDDAKAAQVLRNEKRPAEKKPDEKRSDEKKLPEKKADEKKAPEPPKKENLPTAIGVPALPQTLPLSATPTPTPGAVANVTHAGIGPPPQARTTTSMPPPLPPKASKPPPPPAKKKNKTLIMYGGAPGTSPPPGPGAEKVAPPINVPGPGGQSPQAITRPPPADGSAQVSTRPPLPPPMPIEAEPESIEELSGSILLEDRESAVESVVLSDSVRKVSATLPPKLSKAKTGTLLGFPVPTAPAPDVAAHAPISDAPPRPPRTSVADDAPAGLPSNRILHDLRELMRRPRPKFFWPAIGVGGAAVFLGLVGLLIGAARGKPGDETQTAASATPKGTATSGTAVGPGAATQATPSAPALPAAAVGDKCALTGAAHTIAPRTLVPAGVEVQVTGVAIGLGFAIGPKDALAVEVDPTSLTVGASAKQHAADTLKRVVPDATGGKLSVVGELDRHDRIQGRRMVPGPTPIDVGVAEGNLVWAPHLKDAYTKLWPLDGDGAVEALRGAPIEVKGEKGFAVSFRRSGAIWMGAALGEKTLAPRGPLFRIVGLGPVVGSPTIASSGDSILIAWADRAAASEPWGLRWVKFTPGEAPRDAVAFHPPAGGLGEHAMSPWLTAVGGGRYLFLWTEGPVSAHQVRAQTLNLDGAPLGDAFTVSGEGINAGQAQAATLPDGRGVVAFLAAKGKSSEVIAAPIVCPPAK